MKNLEISMNEQFAVVCHARFLMLIEYKNASSYTSHIAEDYYEVKATIDVLKMLKELLNKRQIRAVRNMLYKKCTPIKIKFKDNTIILLEYEKFKR